MSAFSVFGRTAYLRQHLCLLKCRYLESMKKFSLGCLFLFAAMLSFAQGPSLPGKLLVKVKADSPIELQQFKAGEAIPAYAEYAGMQAMLAHYGTKAFFKPFKTQTPQVQKIYEVRFDALAEFDAFIKDWQDFSFIEYAEQIPLYEMHYTPNDLRFLQWGIPVVKAEEAWDLNRGSRSVTVAVVDDAVLMSHEDLAPQIWTNLGEIPGDSIDNDGNGFIDDVNGYDLGNEDNDPNPPSGANDNAFSHGTHTSGIACAATDNGVGVTSIAFNATLVPVKVKEDSTIGDNLLQATYTGLDYAIANNFDVVNMSFGSPNYNFSMFYLIQSGHDSGMVFIASAGNTGSYSVNYPAAYDNVISVGSTEFDDSKSGFSTYHYSVDVMAPGGGIQSSVAGGDDHYGFKSGTSMSAPMAASLAALLLSADSTLVPDDLEACLKSGCDNIDGNNSAYLGNIGAGRINAYNSLLCIGIPAAVSQSEMSGFHVNRIFPNPVTEKAFLSGNMDSDGTLKIDLLDLGGRELTQIFQGEVNVGDFEYQMDRPAEVANGLYLLRWEFEGNTSFQKVLIQ